MAYSPQFIEEYLKELEKCAGEIISDQQQIVELDQQRNGNREALRLLTKTKKTNANKTWICMSNVFLNLSKDNAVTTIQKEQEELDAAINSLRDNLRKKVDVLRELEAKEPTLGSKLKPLSRQEWAAVKQTLGQ